MLRVMQIPVIQERRDHITQQNGKRVAVLFLRTCPVQEKFEPIRTSTIARMSDFVLGVN
jgi:hypothetical protein